MKPSKIIIATAVLILLSSLLSGCSLVSTNQAVRPSAGEQKITALRQVKKSVNMKLLAERNGNEVRVRGMSVPQIYRPMSAGPLSVLAERRAPVRPA